MGYIITMTVFAVVCGIAFLIGKNLKNTPLDGSVRRVDEAQLMRRAGAITMWSAVIIFILLGSIVTITRSFHSVAAGHVGVVYQFGNIVDQTEAGLVQTWPWQSLKEANVQVQRAHFDNLTSFSSETQDVFIAATLNYRADSQEIQRLYREVGPDYFEKLIPSRVNQLFKDETVKYKAVLIAPKRESIRKNVRQRLADDPVLKKYSLSVEDLLIDNIRFSPEFTQAIENKQIATQDAQTAFNRVEQAKQEAQQLIEKAQGEAAAYRLRNKNLTPLLVQQNAIDKLNPNVEIIILPSNSNFLFPQQLLGRAGR